MSENTTLAMRMENASGNVDFPFTNDYMFRAALQRNTTATKALVAALLHLEISEISEIAITNPIVLGEAVSRKDFILDLRILINNTQIINLEMQVLNRHNWPERSLSYACRAFDQLKSGAEYAEVLPVINIGFLDFTLFGDAPEFYSRHLLMNVKTHKIYSDKLDIRVIELNQIQLATEEDRFYQIDRWAKLFKAATWEEIHMITKNDAYLSEAAQTLYEMNSDDLIRQQCLARLDAERDEARLHQALQQQSQQINQLQEDNNSLKQDIDALRQLLMEHGIQPPN